MEEEVRRKQKKCTYQTERGRNTCLRGRMGDHASSGERRKLRGIKEKIKKTEEKREEYEALYLADGEGEEYMSNGRMGDTVSSGEENKLRTPQEKGEKQ